MNLVETERDRILDASAVSLRYGVDRSTLHRWLVGHGFPKPFYLAHRRRWKLSALVAWEESQQARGGRSVDHLVEGKRAAAAKREAEALAQQASPATPPKKDVLPPLPPSRPDRLPTLPPER